MACAAALSLSGFDALKGVHPVFIEGAARSDARDAVVVGRNIVRQLRLHWQRRPPPPGPKVIVIQGDPYAEHGISAITRVVSEDLQHCTALEVNSGPRQCAEEFEMQLGMYEIALGLETTPADEGLRWLELRPPTAAVAGGGSGGASRCSGKVAAWVKSNRVLEPAPEPEPAPAPTRGHEAPAAAAVAALVETHAGGGGGEPRGGGGHSTPAAPGDSAVGTAKPHASGAAVGAFLSSMPGLV